MPEAVGIDVGGTKIAALRVDAGGTILARYSLPSPASDEAALAEAMAAAARELITPQVVAVGVGAAGMVEHATGVLRSAPNLAWREFALTETMTRALSLPCIADNDANAATWGEWKAGAGRGARNLLMVTIGTGIGGGIVSDGRLMRGAHGYAAEVGHIIVEPAGPECGCGNRGCWEQVASGRAIDRLAREAVAAAPDAEFARRVTSPDGSVSGTAVSSAAVEGDGTALGILGVVGTRLGEGLAGLANVLDPELIVVGGGGAEAGEALLQPARAAFLRCLEAAELRPEVRIVAAALGNDAGALGAALMALEEHA